MFNPSDSCDCEGPPLPHRRPQQLHESHHLRGRKKKMKVLQKKSLSKTFQKRSTTSRRGLGSRGTQAPTPPGSTSPAGKKHKDCRIANLQKTQRLQNCKFAKNTKIAELQICKCKCKFSKKMQIFRNR